VARDFAYGFYSSKPWRIVRHDVLRRDHYTCRDCFGRASMVHHIEPLTPSNINDYSISLNPDNLVAMCWLCHNKETKGYTGDIDTGYSFADDGQVIQTIKEDCNGRESYTQMRDTITIP